MARTKTTPILFPLALVPARRLLNKELPLFINTTDRRGKLTTEVLLGRITADLGSMLTMELAGKMQPVRKAWHNVLTPCSYENRRNTRKRVALLRAEIEGRHNANSFHVRTIAEYTRCARPRRKPDFTSPSGSKYWFTDTGVIRASDHWGRVRSCYWTIDRMNGKPNANGEIAGHCAWEDFKN